MDHLFSYKGFLESECWQVDGKGKGRMLGACKVFPVSSRAPLIAHSRGVLSFDLPATPQISGRA